MADEDFDNRVRDFLVKQFKKKYDLDPTKDAKTMDKLLKKLSALYPWKCLPVVASKSKTFWIARTFLKSLLVPKARRIFGRIRIE